MTYCHVSAQIDAYAEEMGRLEDRADAIERHAAELAADYMRDTEKVALAMMEVEQAWTAEQWREMVRLLWADPASYGVRFQAFVRDELCGMADDDAEADFDRMVQDAKDDAAIAAAEAREECPWG